MKKIEINELQFKNLNKLFPMIYSNSDISLLTKNNSKSLFKKLNEFVNDGLIDDKVYFELLSDGNSEKNPVVLQVIFIQFNNWYESRVRGMNLTQLKDSIDTLSLIYTDTNEDDDNTDKQNKLNFSHFQTYLRTTITFDGSKPKTEWLENKDNLLKEYINNYIDNIYISYNIIDSETNKLIKEVKVGTKYE